MLIPTVAQAPDFEKVFFGPSPSSFLSSRPQHHPFTRMSLYSVQNIQFLPKPHRSWLSLGSEADRLQFPDFDDVAALQSFVSRLFVYDFDYVPSLAVQLKFGAIFVAFLLLIVISIIARRMYEQSFWVVQIVKRPTGRLIVPNSMLCFAIIEGFFCATFMAMMWCIYATMYPKSIPAVINPIWMLLPWCPLIGGAVWAAWGLYFATPPSHLRGGMTTKDQRWRRRNVIIRMLDQTIISNMLGLCLPIIISGSVIVPSIKAMQHWSMAYRMMNDWQRRYDRQSIFTTPMVQEAQLIWYKVLMAMRMVTVGYLIWAGWALLIFAAYTGFSVRLIRIIRHETHKMNDIGPRTGIAVIMPASLSAQKEESERTVNEHQTCQSPQDTFKVEWRGSLPMYKATQTTCSNDSQAITIPTHANGWRRYFSRPNIVMQVHNQRSTFVRRQLRRDQVNMLNKALLHICIQACAIGPACFTFFVISLGLGVGIFSSTEHTYRGGTYVEPVLAVAISAAIWTVVVFGGITLLAIAQRTYEHMFGSVYFNAQSCVMSGVHGSVTVKEAAAAKLYAQGTNDVQLDHINSFGERIATRMRTGTDEAIFQIQRDESGAVKDLQPLTTTTSTTLDVLPFLDNDAVRDRQSLQDWPDARIGDGVKIERTTFVVQDKAN